jgi:predicted RNA-binding Zn-ribbon protein involved in translation (DUF1610 family)
MIGGRKKENHYSCTGCGFLYSNLDASRVCSNCFACTGCEIYLCPSCGEEVVFKPKKPMNSEDKK